MAKKKLKKVANNSLVQSQKKRREKKPLKPKIFNYNSWTGRRFLLDTYRFLNGVPLRDGKEALEVNWCELITTVEDSGKVVYKNAFATNFEITEKNVKEIVADGRARWKIENENNNILKTKGYHLEHNFGHGKKYLATLLLTFNLKNKWAISKIMTYF